MTLRFDSVAKAVLSPAVARVAKQVAAHPRYLRQRYHCRQGYVRYGERYPQKILFVAGLPKSGTSWLEQMLAAYPGFYPLMHPDAVAYERVSGGSHDYDLAPTFFQQLRQMLVVTKLHIHGSQHNVQLLDDANLNYVVLYRDLRDVALSYYFYVRQTPWHPEYVRYRNLAVEEALLTFADNLLLPYAKWIAGWQRYRHADRGIMIRYEDLVHDPEATMTKVAHHFALASDRQTIQSIVNTYRFERLSHGRAPGEQDVQSFFRKGVAGDWRMHFTPRVVDTFKQKVGDYLIHFGYEHDFAW